MITLRNIDKRRELQQDVYNNYGVLTEEERRELNHEVGAAFRGYETAMRDIIQLLVNGDKGKWGADTTILCIKKYILEQLNGKATKNIFRFSEVPSTQMQVRMKQRRYADHSLSIRHSAKASSNVTILTASVFANTVAHR